MLHMKYLPKALVNSSNVSLIELPKAINFWLYPCSFSDILPRISSTHSSVLLPKLESICICFQAMCSCKQHQILIEFWQQYLQMLEDNLKLVERQVPNCLDILLRRVLTNDCYRCCMHDPISHLHHNPHFYRYQSASSYIQNLGADIDL